MKIDKKTILVLAFVLIYALLTTNMVAAELKCSESPLLTGPLPSMPQT